MTRAYTEAMNKLLLVVAAIATAVPARAGSALECLKASEVCLGRTPAGAPAVAGRSSISGPAVRSTKSVKKPVRHVPTPTGWRDDEDGTLTTGFYKGLDSGFKSGFAAVEWLPVAGMEAFGAPYRKNAGTIGFLALGVILSLPAAVIGAVAAPFGAVAGMIAEKVSPGATKDWFTF